MSLKGSNCRGVADASTVPPKDIHGKVGGMVRPASLAIESEKEEIIGATDVGGDGVFGVDVSETFFVL